MNTVTYVLGPHPPGAGANPLSKFDQQRGKPRWVELSSPTKGEVGALQRRLGQSPTLAICSEVDAECLPPPWWGRIARPGERLAASRWPRLVRTPHRLSSGLFGGDGGIEGGAGFEHGAGNVEQAVGDRSEGAGVAVTSASQGGVFGAACWVVLNGSACPMVHGVGQAAVAGVSPDDHAALAGALGDGRDSCQTAQGGVISPLQGIEGFCKQRGEDDPSHSRQGCEDLHVMLLCLPRLSLLGRGEAGSQGIKPVMGLLELPVDEADAGNERGDVGAGGLGGAGGNFVWAARAIC